MSKADYVYEQLKEAIIEHRISPATRLPTTTIAESLGVSRTPVQQALVKLSDEGLVDIEPQVGAKVVQPTRRDIEETFAVRGQLEGYAAQLAANNFTREQIATLKEYIEEEKRAFDNRDVPGLLNAARKFHKEIVETSGNQLLIRIVMRLINRSHVYLTLYEALREPAQSPGEHEEIINSLQASPQVARKAMEEHIQSTVSLLDLDLYRLRADVTEVLQIDSDNS